MALEWLAVSNMIGLANTGERDHGREAKDNFKNEFIFYLRILRYS